LKAADEISKLSIAGELRFDTDARDAAGTDFGRLVHKRPLAVLKPASSEDIVTIVRWANSQGLKVAARGQGHAIYGRAMVHEGIVIDMSTMNTITSPRAGEDYIVAEAGATWGAVLDATLACGRTPPVLTNFLGLSVGGTLAVGGIGPMTGRSGLQTDNVLEMDVVSGDGRALCCSMDRNVELFDAIRGGLAQCAIATRVKLRTVPAPKRAYRVQLFYSDLSALTADQHRVLSDGRFDFLQGAILPDGAGGWRYQLEGVVFCGDEMPSEQALLAGLSCDPAATVASNLSYRDDANAFARLESILRSNGQWFNPQPWLLTFLPEANAEQIAAEILQQLTNDDVGPFGRITYFPIQTHALNTPLARKPGGNLVVVFNLLRIPATDDLTEIERMIARNREIYEHIRSRGGFLYPVSAFPMSRADWQQHFGPLWASLNQAKDQYDPLRVLTPGYELF
jgi:cytokinin dehydrogenase